MDRIGPDRDHSIRSGLRSPHLTFLVFDLVRVDQGLARDRNYFRVFMFRGRKRQNTKGPKHNIVLRLLPLPGCPCILATHSRILAELPATVDSLSLSSPAHSHRPTATCPSAALPLAGLIPLLSISVLFCAVTATRSSIFMHLTACECGPACEFLETIG
ncbi:hypothetical protein Cgig2_024072 [Carnegiea gigantea]|uniref:Uncharacterized protein n=1 Tax=Carnegiea gigantea TaxID=171969 RepID=A0A9Q1K6N8_9CARY|nr:hypothetical protein Cgig2_024072 [Carnegiea gigantea]